LSDLPAEIAVFNDLPAGVNTSDTIDAAYVEIAEPEEKQDDKFYREETIRCTHCGVIHKLQISEENIKKLGYIEAADLALMQACFCDGSKKALKERSNRNFKGFVTMDLVNFMEDNKLEEISVKTANGNKAKIKRDKDNNLNVETTIKDRM
jgi:hypothetical protein